ncbi:MAG: long-chain fatty acid--CoA ligase, partial [Candidatus Krumholzibacteria bacterium]|nr:long-chain fatty acid--CoA ligase [Candidatus Krumholzibacteria bacterium]
ELINVGGEKVYPAEVENVVIEMNNVVNAVVYGEPNPITGTIVVVDVALADPEDRVDFTKRLKKYCGAQLESFKIPVKVNIVSEPLHSERFKKTRRKPAKGNGA